MSKVTKKWYEVWQDDYFWLLKIKTDYPELIIPYKNSQFHRIYRHEYRRRNLLALFKFGVTDECEKALKKNVCVGRLAYDDEFDAERKVAILTTLTGHTIWSDTENEKGYDITLYGMYKGVYPFKVTGSTENLEYVFSQVAMSIWFQQSLDELINLTEPSYYDGGIGDHIWTHVDEYFGMNRIPLVPHRAFKPRQENLETICLLEGNEEYATDRWLTIACRAGTNGHLPIEGIYYGRNIVIYKEGNKIWLKVEPLMSNRLVEDLKNTLKTLY